MSIDEQSMSRTYSGSVASADLDLGKLLNQEKKFGKVDFNVELKGFNYKNRYPESYIKGIISSFEYSQYQYENIMLDGVYIRTEALTGAYPWTTQTVLSR